MAQSHVFVTLGDVTNVACDAWLLPTDRRLSVNSGWTEAVPGLREAIDSSPSEYFRSGQSLALPVAGWPVDVPLPVLTAVPLYGVASADEFAPALRQFIADGANAARERRNARGQDGRPKPLLATPLFGTGAGGAGRLRGDVMQLLLAEARSTGADLGVDIVFVLRDHRDFALAQELRRRVGSCWDSLPDSLRAEARDLATDAKDGRLVPFMGAGVSVSAGAPTWKELIERLADRMGLSVEERKSLAQRNVLDQAEILRAMYAEREQGGPSFNEVVAGEVELNRYGLAPALLASLPCQQAITLNYDSLFEQAARDANMTRTVIPGDRMGVSDRWVLKLHGSVDDPESIVLTRDDYLGYDTNREALSALVKANLITHRLLFVGFGLADDQFHQIVHDVRRALPEESRQRHDLATALTLNRDAMDERAWQGKLTLLPMCEGAEIGEAARTLEIFLDMLLAYATDNHSYLLAEGYEEALLPEEKSLRHKLLSLNTGLSEAESATTAGEKFSSFLRQLGDR